MDKKKRRAKVMTNTMHLSDRRGRNFVRKTGKVVNFLTQLGKIYVKLSCTPTDRVELKVSQGEVGRYLGEALMRNLHSTNPLGGKN